MAVSPTKFVKVSEGDYYLQVQQGGSITFDTLNSTATLGTVFIKGNLQVDGDTTYVNATDLQVEDNIIEVNRNENGNGITLGSAGMKMNRGSRSDAMFVYDEAVVNPLTPLNDGLFVFKLENGTLKGIKTNHINSTGGDLYLINEGTGVISVTGTVNYENQVTDDDDVPNKKYVDDAITTAFATSSIKEIGEGTVSPSRITVNDEEVSGSDSVIEFALDGTVKALFYGDRFELDQIRVRGTTIETIESNEDLILSAPGTGSIRVDDVLHINSVPGIDTIVTLPPAPTDGIKIYVDDQAEGGTGIFFINSQSTRDEIISNNRSLIYSMIF